MTRALGTFRAFYLVALCCVGSFLFAYDTGIVGGILTFPSFQRDFRYTTKDKANVGSLSTSLLQAGGEYITLFFYFVAVMCWQCPSAGRQSSYDVFGEELVN